jgi:hypothetical protein
MHSPAHKLNVIMKIETISYSKYVEGLPKEGKHIIGHQTEDSIVVYQAYRPAIADYAVKHQRLGGNDFSYDRMSWIKPGFLWMMYRCGWASKQDQEWVLALWLSKDDFKKILEQAVPSTFKVNQFEDIGQWKKALKQKEVRLQWDPDHTPYGGKQERKAIQLGLKGEMLATFGEHFITQIDDVTGFVKAQYEHVKNHNLDQLQVPIETAMEVDNIDLRKIIGMP